MTARKIMAVGGVIGALASLGVTWSCSSFESAPPGSERSDASDGEAATGADASGPGDKDAATPIATGDAARPGCSTLGAGVDFCDDFDDVGAPDLSKWTLSNISGQDGGITLGTTGVASPPRSLTIALEPRSSDSGVDHFAYLERAAPSNSNTMKVEADYWLEACSLVNEATAGTAAILSAQSFANADSNVFVQLQASCAKGGGGAPILQMAIYRGPVPPVVVPLPIAENLSADGGIVVRRWQRLTLIVKVDPPENVTVSVSHNGVALLESDPYGAGTKTTTKWSVWVGGYSEGIPTPTRPKFVHVYDNVTMDTTP